jgi:trigger factor
MNITRENTGELTATVKLEITPADYSEKVNKVLKDYQHKANIPGFRPGKVPVGLIKKMYGKAVMAEEINKLISDSLIDYIHEQDIEMLGNPLPNHEKNEGIQFDKEESFNFYFDLGFAPKIDFTLSEAINADRYVIQIEDEMVDRYIEDSRRRFGKTVNPEQSGEQDMITGELTELDAKNEPAENGIKKEVYLTISQLQKEEPKKALTGLVRESRIVIVPSEFFADAGEASRKLGLPKDTLEKENLSFELFVKDIHHVEPAEINQELFELVYPGKEIETEEQFREEVRQDAAKSFSGEADKLFYNLVIKKLTEEVPVALPDEFLKRWLLENRETKLTAEDIEKEYPAFADSTKWQILENKILKDNKVEVTEDEVRTYIKSYFKSQIPSLGDDPEAETRFDKLVDTVMKNEEQVRKIYQELYDGKLMELFRNTLTVNDHEVSYQEFINLAASLRTHDHDHDHDHGHEHEHDH